MLFGCVGLSGFAANAEALSSAGIEAERIYINVDTSGANSILNQLHSKIPHRNEIIEKVGEFLND